MLRMLGAPPGRLLLLLLCEALWLALLASLLGLALGHGLAEVVGRALAAQGSLPVTGGLWLPREALVPVVAAAVAGVAAVIPALGAYRVDAAYLLNSRPS
jgi:putative ABC transport system permease protein